MFAHLGCDRGLIQTLAVKTLSAGRRVHGRRLSEAVCLPCLHGRVGRVVGEERGRRSTCTACSSFCCSPPPFHHPGWSFVIEPHWLPSDQGYARSPDSACAPTRPVLPPRNWLDLDPHSDCLRVVAGLQFPAHCCSQPHALVDCSSGTAPAPRWMFGLARSHLIWTRCCAPPTGLHNCPGPRSAFAAAHLSQVWSFQG